MRVRTSSRAFLIAVVFLGLVVPSGVLPAQGRSAEAFERVREVHERHIQRLMAIKDVEGTAIGLDKNARLSVKVFTARRGTGGIPEMLDGVGVTIDGQ